MVKSKRLISPPSCIPKEELSGGYLHKDYKAVFTLTQNVSIKSEKIDKTSKITVNSYTKTALMNNTIILNETRTSKEMNNDSFPYGLTIPEWTAEIPPFVIPDFPRLNTDNNGCNECEEENSIPLCDFKVGFKKKCKKILGKKICVTIPQIGANKCLYEVVKDDLEISRTIIYEFKETKIKLDFEIMPNIDMETTFTIGNETLGVFDYSQATGSHIKSNTPVLSFTIYKFKFGLSILIKNLEITYDGKGVFLKDMVIPLIPAFDYLPSSQFIQANVKANGEINLFQLLENQEWTLYDILAPLLNVINVNTPEIVLNFLKQLTIHYYCGILICPLPNPAEPNYVSFYNKLGVIIYPFRDLNRIPEFKVPEKYTNIPKIPKSDYVPEEIRKKLNDYIINYSNISIDYANKYIKPAQEFVKNTLENIPLPVPKTIDIPLIPKVTTLVGI